MIAGQVNASLEAIVRIPLLDLDGNTREIEAVVDTGFSGSLTLPSALIADLGLPWRTRASVTLANGDEELCDVHDGIIVWDGRPRLILIEQAETEPLLGMGLLRDHELHLQAIPGGFVRIEAVP